jgi:hypothetical protein
MTTLSKEDKTKFWLRVYFGSGIENDIILATIDRAYRDFNRTMHGIAKKNTDETYNRLRYLMKEIVSDILINIFNQDSFDIWHQESCEKLIKGFDEITNYRLFYGQAQKWINMSLKYMFAIGDKKINGINKNYKFFHIPIDNIIQEKLILYKIDKIPIKWSRINDYSTYMEYQNKIRNVFFGQIPMDVEFRLFNGEAEIN